MADNTGFTQNIDTLFSDLQNFVKTDSVIGCPVNVENKTLVPVMSITLGYGSTGMGKRTNTDVDTTASTTPNGIGLGARVSTNAVVVIDKSNDTVSMLPTNEKSNMSQLMDKIPQVLQSVGQNISQMTGMTGSGQQSQSQNQSEKNQSFPSDKSNATW